MAGVTDLAGLNVNVEDFLAGVLQAAAPRVWVADHDGAIRFASAAAITALGYERADELLGRPGHETIHGRHPDGTPHPAADCPVLGPLATGETAASDGDWFVRRDGSTLRVSWVSVPLGMRDGRGAIVAFTAIGGRRRAEQVLREHDAPLAAQQASLRRVATLVAGGAGSADVFAAVAEEVGQVTGLPLIAVWRYEGDATATVLGAWSDQPHPFQAGTRWPLDGPTICAQVLETGGPAKIDDFVEVPGTIADAARETGIRACAGAPIIVEGEVWGAMSADSTDRAPLPAYVEYRLAEFTELLAAAILTTVSREELARLADEQAALRRVATLVARGVPPLDVFAAVTREVGQLLKVSSTHMGRYDDAGAVTGVGSWSPHGVHMPVGTRRPFDASSISGMVFTTGRPARRDHYDDASAEIAATAHQLQIRSSVAAPIVLDEHLWGVMIASSNSDRRLPADTEARIAAFTELVATAISNTEARTETARLSNEQAALRRVATLVARESSPEEVFAAVAEELGRLLLVDGARVIRYDDDGTASVLASWGEHDVPVGTRVTLDTDNVGSLVLRTGRPARIDDYSMVTGSNAAFARELGFRSAIGSPILVEGRLWGAMIAVSLAAEPLPAGTESRIAEFTELIATAILNLQARENLAASRARIVAATEEERQRVVRDLHDGAQQRLVHTIITLKLAHQALPPNQEPASALVAEALANAERANVELRELAHGILPVVLTHGGLREAVKALASRTPVTVEVTVSVDRLPAPVEATAYFVIAEALTNITKHAKATAATVRVHIEDGTLKLQVRDDGVGGARPDGSGLVGLADRLAVLDGQLRVESPADGGTLVAADFPLRR